MVVVVVVDVKAEDDTTDYGVDFGARRSFALLLFGGSIMTTSFCFFCVQFKVSKKVLKKKKNG